MVSPGGHIAHMSINQPVHTHVLTWPNVITLARICAVPVVAWLILSGQWLAAFWLFVIAGASDAVDGIIARWFDQSSTLGAWLDPLADKALLATAFVLLAVTGFIPVWLVALAVGRDLLILSGVAFAQATGGGLPIRPLFVSKATTAFQIALIALVMASRAFGFDAVLVERGLIWGTAALTAASLAAYAQVWMRHVARKRARRDG